MPFADHDDFKKFLADSKAAAAAAAPASVPAPQPQAQPQAMVPPPLQAPSQRPDNMPKTWDYGQLPQFLQDGIDKAKMRYIKETDKSKYADAAVGSDDPYAVHVVNPNTSQSIMDHELTHTLQFLHPEAKFAAVATEGDKYDYGGADGLIKVAGKKQLSDYSIEQTARMVQDYAYERDKIFNTARKMPLDEDDLKRWNQVQAAYAPLMRQLGQVGGHKYPEYKPVPGQLTDLPEFSGQSLPYKMMQMQVSMGPK
jgi:hypothetical protein